MSTGSRVQRYVDGGMRSVGEEGAFVDGKVSVGISKNQGGDTATLQFQAETACECEADVFLGESEAEGLATIGATVTGVDDREITARGRRRSRRCLRGRNVLRHREGWFEGCGCGRLRFRGSECDRAAIIAEGGHERNGCGNRDLGGTVALGIFGGGNVLTGEGESGGRRRGNRFVAEGHVQFAGFSGDGGIDGRCELKDEVGGIVGGD